MRFAFTSLILMLPMAGCGDPSAPLTSVQDARKALEAGLDAWKAGRPVSTLAAAKPPIDFVDFQWKAGQKLSSYSVASDASDPEGHTFKVGLSLAGEPAQKEVSYTVVGIDPLHIFRDEDYARTLNMGDAPTVRKSAKKTR
ncbi:hypothetical protein [Paludisphaera mucosa]|uniref:Lipoprotein n=1 Tax=Paludisphaera mucosa TaxID=3030827 RepID=A0ABT6F6H2_9BACT|nr:hypothetical protein [Paludisphaera mucosa]MDG3003187.1 hypothetical protein [Paludisphaera mucosa]